MKEDESSSSDATTGADAGNTGEEKKVLMPELSGLIETLHKPMRKNSKAHIRAILGDFNVEFKGSDNVATLKERYNAQREDRPFVAPPKAARPSFGGGNEEVKPAVEPAVKVPDSVEAKVQGTYYAKNGGAYRFGGRRVHAMVNGNLVSVDKLIVDAAYMEGLVNRKSKMITRVS